MKTSSISEIKKALLVLDNFQVVELCLRLAKYKKEMLKYWEELPPVFTSSSDSGFGKEPLLNYIEQILA